MWRASHIALITCTAAGSLIWLISLSFHLWVTCENTVLPCSSIQWAGRIIAWKDHMCIGPAGRQTAPHFTFIAELTMGQWRCDIRGWQAENQPFLASLLYTGSMKTERLLPVLQPPPGAAQTPLTMQYFPELLWLHALACPPGSGQDLKQLWRAQLAPAWDGFLWCYLQSWMLHSIPVSSQGWAEAVTHPGRQPGWWTLRALPAAGPSPHPPGWSNGQGNSPA